MAEETSIVIKAEDRYSDAVKSMAKVTKSFSKDAEDMQQMLDKLGKNKVVLQMDARKAQSELQALQKQFKATGKEADGLKVEMAQQNYDNIQKNLRLVTQEARAVEKQMASTAGAVRKAENSIGGGGRAGSMLGGFAGNMLAQAASQIVQQGIGVMGTSALGSAGGNILSGALSTMITGATAGAMLGGAPGAILGGVIGGATGAVSGGLQQFGGMDEVFRAHYTQLLESAQTGLEEAMTSGSGIAAGREKDLISFSTLFGSRNTAQGYLHDLVDMANTTPFLYDDLTAMSKTLATYGYGANNILPVLQTIGDAGAALGMGTGDMTMVATALGRMKSSNKTTLEYLNILNDRGIGAVGMLADAYGVDQGTIYEQISKGKIDGGSAVAIILQALTEKYSGSMVKQSETYEGKSSTLTGLEQELENAMGSGYNTGVLSGIQGDIDAYGGKLGDALKGMNAMIGEGRAMAENLERQYKREALSALTGMGVTTLYEGAAAERLKEMNSEYTALRAEFDGADESRKAEIGAKLEALKGEAESLAGDAYRVSETGLALHDVELDQITAIRENTAALGAWKQEYESEQEKTKGLGKVAMDNWTLGSGFRGSTETGEGYVWGVKMPGYAYGLDRVPYDNYPALLHQGERVLTAQEARAADSGGGGVSVQIGQVSFGSDVGDPEQAAEAFARALERELMMATP